MALELPRFQAPRAPQTWSSRTPALAPWLWNGAALPDFYRADGSGPARQQTVTRVCFDDQTLYVRFDCDDRDLLYVSIPIGYTRRSGCFGTTCGFIVADGHSPRSTDAIAAATCLCAVGVTASEDAAKCGVRMIRMGSKLNSGWL